MRPSTIVVFAVASWLGVIVVATRPAPEAEPAPRSVERPPPASSDPVAEEFAERGSGGSLEARSDWAPSLYAAAGDPGIYRPGESRDTRPFDDSDPEMQRLMAEVYAVGGCGRPGVPCAPAMERLRRGGDRLAAYLIRQLVESERGGWPNNDTFVAYIAYTGSDTGLRFIRERIASRASLSAQDHLWAVDMLGETARLEAIDVALELLRDPTLPKHYVDHLANVLWKIPLATRKLHPEGLEVLRELSARGWVNAQGGLRAVERHFDLETGKPRDVPLPLPD